MIGQGLAVCAGLCAALASTCAKMAVDSDSVFWICGSVISFFSSKILISADEDAANSICDQISIYIRVTFFALVFVFNALMWTLFTKSLQKCSSSIEATVTNTSANFFCTAVMGWLFFGETLSLMWLAGASLIITGLILIHRGNSGLKDKEA